MVLLIAIVLCGLLSGEGGVVEAAAEVSATAEAARIREHGGSQEIFGPCSIRAWITASGEKDVAPIEVYCVETAYTDYDIEQQGGKYTNEAIRSALIVHKDTGAILFGPYHDGGRIVLLDLAFLAERPSLENPRSIS